MYESNGLQVKPTTSLGAYFEKRKASALVGVPFTDPITVDLAGPKNGRPGYYDWDKNNLQPRIAIAWSPNFSGGFLKKFFVEGDSVIRGGFAMTNDAFGQQLAVQFDLNNTLGFSSTEQIAANTFNVSDRPGPRFTGIGQNVRNLPFIPPPSSLVFPLQTPSDQAQRRSSLDDTLVTPTNYSWTASFGRGISRVNLRGLRTWGAPANLLATRDSSLNNIVDPKSGLGWYTAARQLAALQRAHHQRATIAISRTCSRPIEPSAASCYANTAAIGWWQEVGANILDWTFVQSIIDDRGVVPNMFFHPQYAALSTFSTVASSDYHAGELTIRQRYHDTLTWDLNYTFSRSIDDASGLQTSGAFGAAFILNPLRPKDNRAASDFDITHIVNANASISSHSAEGGASGANRIDGIRRLAVEQHFPLELGSVRQGVRRSIRLNGRPTDVQSFGVRTVPLESVNTRGANNPNLFGDPVAAYGSIRNALPGETGDRNFLRIPSYISLDMGLSKSFNMPGRAQAAVPLGGLQCDQHSASAAGDRNSSELWPRYRPPTGHSASGVGQPRFHPGNASRHAVWAQILILSRFSE